MESMQVRINDENLRMKIAMDKYIDDEFSLCRAAEFTGVSIQQMAKYLSEKGLPFFNLKDSCISPVRSF
ncbi:MAG: hypothetical protein FIB08_03225 [Candidatus Methanoperedens sp.]|nr:hypothetical protein [Candidatus Methanoperedens sp.]